MTTTTTSSFIAKGIDPALAMLANTQRFIFGNSLLPDPLGALSLDNIFTPVSNTPSLTDFGWRNKNLNGYRIRHETALGDTIGKLKFQSFLAGSSTATDIMAFNQDGTITLNGAINFDDLNFAKLGIGIDPVTNGQITFANTPMNVKVQMYLTAGGLGDFDGSGFGYLANYGTLYHCPFGQSHVFYAGANGSPVMQLNGQRMLLDFGGQSTDYRKICFKETANNPHQTWGTGIQLDGTGNNYILFNNQLGASSSSFTWKYGLSDSSSYELARLNIGNGLVVNAPIRTASSTLAKFELQNVAANGKIFELHSTSTGLFKIFQGGGDLLTLTAAGVGNFPGSLGIGTTLNVGSTANFVGNISVGMPTYNLAGLYITNGVQNVANESTMIRVSAASLSTKIELENTNSGSKLWEFRCSSVGLLDVTYRTGLITPLSIDTAGNVGLGITPHANLQLSNAIANRKLVIYEDTNNDHQYKEFGHNPGIFRFQTNNTTDAFVFYAGTSATTSTEAGRLTGAGDLTIPGTIYGKTPRGGLYFQANANVISVNANTWAKVSIGANVTPDSNLFSMSGTRLTYNGTTPITVQLVGSCSIAHSTVSPQTVGVALYKNGGQISSGVSFLTIPNSTISVCPLISVVQLANTDYIEIYMLCNASTSLTVSYLTLMVTVL